MNDSESHHLQTKFVVTCAILALIGISVALSFRSGQSSEAFPFRVAADLKWVDVYLRSDMLAALTETSQVDRHSLEAFLGRTPRLTEAWNKLQVANKHWEGRRQRAAKAAWEGIAHAYPETDAAYAALSNLADVLKAQHQMPDAIDAFQTILDLEPPVLHDMNMNDRNYRHHTCCELSKIHEENGDLERAEKYARQASEQEMFCDFCGMWANSVRRELRERVKSLQARTSK